MQLFNVTQQVKAYLSDKPELLRKYVNFGTVGVYYAIQPINAVMRHLILVQGLDPNTVPGEKERREFSEALNHVFSGMHDKSFDADYDYVWAAKKFAQVRDELPEFDLTRQEFDQYTDIRKLQDPRELEVQQDSGVKVQPSFDTPPGRAALHAQLANDLKVMESPFGTPSTVESNPVNELAAALETLSKIADAIEANPVDATLFLDEELKPEPKELFARTEHLRDLRNAIRSYQQYGDEEKLKAVVSRDEADLKKVTDKDAGDFFDRARQSKQQKEVEHLNKLVKERRVDVADLPDLVREGLDQKVVDQWKQQYGKSSVARKKSPTTKVVKKSKRGSFKRSPRQS